MQATLALLLIVGLLLGAAWLARKVSGGKTFGEGKLKTLGGIALGPRERIVLVEVEDTWLIIGVVPGQIRTLHSMPKGSELSPPTGKENLPFSHWLNALKDRSNAS